MITFTTDQPLEKKQFFLKILYQLSFFFIAYILIKLFAQDRSDTALFIFGAFITYKIAQLLFLDKIQEIGIDEEKKELHYYSKGYFTKLQKRKTSFETLTVKKDDWESKSKWLPKRKILSVEILNEKTLLFEVNMNLDHFSEQKMRDLIATFVVNNIPVK